MASTHTTAEAVGVQRRYNSEIFPRNVTHGPNDLFDVGSGVCGRMGVESNL